MYIIIAIVVLALALVALLMDWSRFTAKVKKNRTKKLAKQPSAHKAREPKRSPKELFPDDAFEIPQADVQSQSQETAQVEEEKKYSHEVEHYLQEADIHFRKGEMKAAEDLYVKAALLDPRCNKAYSRLGVIYLEQGDNMQDAEEAFRQALKTDPNNGYVLNNLGLVLYYQDHYADAIRQFEQAVRQDEYNATRHANLGMAYMAMRQYAKAESSFKKALKLSPNEIEYKDLLNEAIEKKNAHKTMIRR